MSLWNKCGFRRTDFELLLNLFQHHKETKKQRTHMQRKRRTIIRALFVSWSLHCTQWKSEGDEISSGHTIPNHQVSRSIWPLKTQHKCRCAVISNLTWKNETAVSQFMVLLWTWHVSSSPKELFVLLSLFEVFFRALKMWKYPAKWKVN